jgi:hypothetical protein
MNKALISKLKIKPGHTQLVLNSPEGYLSRSSKADVKSQARKQYDFVQLFVRSKADLDKHISKAIKALRENGLLWVAYPKKNSGITTDIHRDYGWDALTTLGFEAVTSVAIDETWTALRFWPKEKVKAVNSEAPSTERKKFTAVLETPDDEMDATFVSIPFNVEEVYGTKGQVKVKAWFDDHPYRGILANMGMGCHVIIVRKDIRHAIGKRAGDKVLVELEKDTEERIVTVPEDLKQALAKSPEAEKFFNTLSYTNKKEYAVWITSAKKIETREKRLSEAVQKLMLGKKNPAQK